MKREAGAVVVQDISNGDIHYGQQSRFRQK